MSEQQYSRNDPVKNFRFDVELDSLIVAGFSEVTGLEAEIETYEFSEGGVNCFRHVVPKGMKYPRLVLRRGITGGGFLLDWYNQCVSGSITRMSGSVILYDMEGTEVRRWKFIEGYPVKCVGPQLKALGNDVAIEAFELVHSGLIIC